MTRVIHEIKAPYKKTHDHKSGEAKHVSIIITGRYYCLVQEVNHFIGLNAI